MTELEREDQPTPHPRIMKATAMQLHCHTELQAAVANFNQALWLGDTDIVDRASRKAHAAFDEYLDAISSVVAVSKDVHKV